MSIASILTVLSGEEGSQGALKTAVTLGQTWGARVVALHVAVDPERSIPLLGEGMTAAMITDLTSSLEAEAQRSTKAAEAIFTAVCTDAGRPVATAESAPKAGQFVTIFDSRKGDEAQTVAEEGRLHDLIIVPRGNDEDGASGPTLEAALFQTGRPVLIPPKGGYEMVPQRIAVAWNGSREASRAVADALPILKHARQLSILSGEGRDDPAIAYPSVLARYLACHGINAQTWRFQPDDWPVSQSLVNEAKKAGASLLVMGAYGHSRLRELVLGGATRAALRSGELGLFMSH